METQSRAKHPRWIDGLAFVIGCMLGLCVLGLWLLLNERVLHRDAPLPSWWSFWLFDANPVVRVVCDVMQRRELCIGLGFDGGPLQGVERAWFVLAQGAPFGLATALAVRFRRRRQRM